MQFYALCPDPLLITLESILAGSRIGRRQVKTTVLAYADDVMILVTAPSDIPKLQSAIQRYEAASGARINFNKPRTMVLGTWNTAANVMNIPYCTELKMLGVHFTPSVRQTTQKNWAMVIGRIRRLAQAAYYRELCLDKRILYVHTYILATAWYTVQILPMPETCVRQVNSAIAWYLWRGNIFRVPLSTLQQLKREGGWGLTKVAAKSQALFIHRLQTHSQDESSVTSEWFRK